MNEEWLPIPFAPRYLASSEGRLIGLRGTLMSPTPNHRMYLVVSLHGVQYRVNRIICYTFHGEPPTALHHAAHKDSDRLNNREDNLYWATPLENGADLAKTNNIKGVANCVNVLTENDVRLIRRLFNDGYRVADIHKQFLPISYGTISHVIHNRTWRHI